MLVVIESPNKVKKYREYLGTGVKVVATVGHFMDLPRDEFAVDLETYDPSFKPVPKTGREVVQKLKAEAKGRDVVIASDPDREGYAIGTFAYREVQKIAKSVKRAEIREITREGITEGVKKAVPFGQSNTGLFDAFLGRRVTDRLMGYLMSPMAKAGLGYATPPWSVGRVQSPALRLVVDRERKIREFVPQPYWVAQLRLKKDGREFLAQYAGGEFSDKAVAESVFTQVRNASVAKVEFVDQRPAKQNPKAPFTTVDLQAAASSHLGFSPEVTQRLAQQLFEGGGGAEEGLITYPRTDCVTVSEGFIGLVRKHIAGEYGSPYLPAKPIQHKSKKSQAEAHEAIRPTKMCSYDDIPGLVGSRGLTDDHAKLLQLIWRRTVASQMASAEFKATTVLFDCNGVEFKAKGRELVFDGFLRVWAEKDEKEGEDQQGLPGLAEGDICEVVAPLLDERKTKAPARYTEAAILKEMERLGIGRPSTYSTILKVLKDREYVVAKQGKIVPTDRGERLVGWLAKNHPWCIDFEFTAHLEEELDLVEERKRKWQDVAKSIHSRLGFYRPDMRERKAGGGSLSDGQMGVVRKHAPAEVVERVEGGDVAAGRAFLDSFFAELKKGKAETGGVVKKGGGGKKKSSLRTKLKASVRSSSRSK